jgi:hypothetical protein
MSNPDTYDVDNDDPVFDIDATIISQYANSPILVRLIENLQQYIDPTTNFDAFFSLIWNVNTAVGYGLDVWGRIVEIERIVRVPRAVNYFGFQEAGPLSANSFNFGIFFGLGGGAPVTDNFTLTDPAYRTLILVKALANITDCSVESLNAMLLALFPGRGNAYVTEPGNRPVTYFGFQEAGDDASFNFGTFYTGNIANNMTLTYTFEFALTPLELAIVEQSGVLPRPNGVAVTVIQKL